MDESTLGELLKSARERRGLSLQQIFEDTKIPLRHLEALERNQLTALPSGLYLRSEVRAYAKTVHLDPDLALRALDHALTPAPMPATEVPEPPPVSSTPRPPRRVLVGAIGLVLLAGALTIVVWKRVPAPTSGEAAPQNPTGDPPSSSDGHATQAIEPASTSGANTDESPGGSDQLAPEPSGDAQLTVATQPEGARVTINGIGWGASPVTIRHLSPGEKRVRVSLDGYTAAERVLDLSEGQRSKVTIQLQPAR